MVEMTGAKALICALEKEGVDTVFGLPGGANLPIYDALVDIYLFDTNNLPPIWLMAMQELKEKLVSALPLQVQARLI
jgi:hypothetical protein